MKLPFLFLLLSFSFLAQAQRFQGKILDHKNAPVPFVNIGVIGQGVGTVSSEQGTFILSLPDSLDARTLQVSAIGYRPVTWKVGEFKQKFGSREAVIHLKEEAVALREVVVRPQKFKTKVVGNETDSKSIMGGFKSNGLGSEIGTVLSINRPSFLEKVTFNLANNAYDTLFLRINIYRMGKNGPEENLLSAPIYLTALKKDVVNGISLDMQEHQIYLEADVLLSLELVKDLGHGGLLFSGGFMNSDSYFRKASQDVWQKVPIIGLGFNATISFAK
ncbi:carboxypeptidase-like regulatory domain-containing protein [Rufibacter glacialis]|nr:carboxypeptidase-like regulatory domain-containing protein [Rufibacter glacialis]GGK65840.1 hypothetical protein GCM10011405_12200 [Rufibacter glacialis]